MARLIVVSGPNGAGKTTLIKNSLAALQQLDYTIIIPDELELQSGSDTPVSDTISYCLQHKKNAIYETPFQYPEIAEQVEKFAAAGYSVVLIQLFLKMQTIQLSE